jgi:hypothetical protein
MFAVLLHVQNVRVAALAGLMAGILDRKRSDFANGIAAVVPVFAKAFGHNIVAHHQEHHKGEDEKPCKSKKMPCILENTHRALSLTIQPGGTANLVHVIKLTFPTREHSAFYPTVVCEEDHMME